MRHCGKFVWQVDAVQAGNDENGRNDGKANCPSMPKRVLGQSGH